MAASPAQTTPLLYRRAVVAVYIARLASTAAAIAIWTGLVARNKLMEMPAGMAGLIAWAPIICLGGAYTNAMVTMAMGKRLVRRADLLNLVAWAAGTALLCGARVVCRGYPSTACLAHRHARAVDAACLLAAAWVCAANVAPLAEWTTLTCSLMLALSDGGDAAERAAAG